MASNCIELASMSTVDDIVKPLSGLMRRLSIWRSVFGDGSSLCSGVRSFGRHWPFLAIGLLSVLALFLRVILLGSYSVWLDESYSVNLASGELQAILGNTGDPHPPFYYVLLHFWLALGSSEFVIRFPSAILGALSVPLTYSLARTWFTERTALLTALFLAISPLHIWYSQEARMYSLVTFLGLASVLALSRLLRGGGLVWWVLYLSATLAGLYTHYGMAVLLLAEGLFVVGRSWVSDNRESRPLVLIGSAQLIALLGFLPWLPALLANAGSAGNLHPLRRLGLLWEGDYLVAGLLSLVALAAVASIALVLRLRKRYPPFWRTEGWSEVAVSGLYILLTVSSAIPLATSVKRQMLLFLPYFLLIAGASAGRLVRARGRWVLVSLVLLTSMALVASYTERETEDWRGAELLVQAGSQPGDVILFHAFYTRSPFDYYYEGALPQIGVDDASFERQLSALAGKYDRAWVILSNEAYRDPELQVRRWINEEWDLVQKNDLRGVTVGLYGISKAPTGESSTMSRSSDNVGS